MGEAGEKQNAAAKAMGFDVIPRSAFVSAETGKPLYNTGQKPVHTDGGVFDPDEAAFHHWWADRDVALHKSVSWKAANAKTKIKLTESQAKLKKLAFISWMASREALRLEHSLSCVSESRN